MFGHISQNNGQGKDSLRLQQEMEGHSVEGQPVASQWATPTNIDPFFIEELQVNTWLKYLRKHR